MLNMIAQILGFIGLACSLLSFQMKKRGQILGFQMTASLMFCSQLFLLGAITGGCMDFISFIRTLIFSNNNKKWASSPLWLVGFCLLMIVTGILTWTNWWDVLPMLGGILSTIALWMKSERKIRLISLSVGPCWLIYNLVKGAWSGALNEVLAMLSIIIGYLRNDVKYNKNPQTTK